MGWLMFLALAVLAGLALWRMRALGPGALLFAGAAAMLAAAGYAWQGRPGQPGHPVSAAVRTIEVDPAIVELRGAMTQRFGNEANWLIVSDAMLRAGEPRTAIVAIRSGIDANPRSVLLWTALGSALVEHDGGIVSPTARFAFERAAALGPRHPAPWFFLGLAQLRAGEAEAAERSWTRAYARAPRDAEYREQLRVRLAVLRRLMLSAPAQVAPRGPAS